LEKHICKSHERKIFQLGKDYYNLPVVSLVPHCHFELEIQQLRSVVLAVCGPSSPHMLAALKKSFIREIVMRFNKSCLYTFTLKPPRIIPKKYGSAY